MKLEELISLIRDSLSPDLLKPRYRSGNLAGNPTYGHCYVATESLYYLLRELDVDGDYLEFRPRCGSGGDGGTHWWLQAPDGRIIDPTREQYRIMGMQPPYASSQYRAFMFTGKAKTPSRRAMELIRRVRDRCKG